jgi:hypothetical protein
MIKRMGIVWLSCLLLGAVGAQAQQKLLIRLVRATNTPHVDPSVRDVVQAMSGSYAYKGFALKAQSTLPLPASGAATLGEYWVSCEGPAEKLKIRVKRGAAQLLNTDVTLITGKPLVLGGFPAQDGHNLLVFTAQ